MSHFSAKAIFAVSLSLIITSSAHAATYTIDGDAGSVYDGVIDGFPFVYPFDGTPDAGNNALSVALKAGVTEMRAVAEFPLDDLAGLTSADIVSATLVFNIDDVIGTFGPGAAFDGTASENIFLWAWSGDGNVDVTDFNNVAGPPAGSVNTGPNGSITDATLAISGPLVFQVNLTARLQALLDASAISMGVTMATTDENTATSLDNMGPGGTGPAGVGGAEMPKLIVVVAESAPPSFGRDELGCQKEIAKQSQLVAAAAQKLLIACFNRVLKDTAAGEAMTEATEYCNDRLDLGSVEAKLTKTRTKAATKIGDKCEDVTPSQVNSPCDAGATTFADTAACIIETATANAESSVRSSYANACAILTAVGLEAPYSTICAGS